MTTTPRPAGSTTAATKPIARRSTLVRKRDESDDTQPSSPTKRAKVTFDDNVKVQDLHEWAKAPGVILEEVRRALQKHGQGDHTGYDALRNVYTAKGGGKNQTSTATLRSYTMALLGNVSALNKNCSDLVYAVLNSEWLGREDDYVRAFMRLMANIVSSQGLFVAEALRMLVGNLTSGKPVIIDSNAP